MDNQKCMLIFGMDTEEKTIISNVTEPKRGDRIVEISDTMINMTIGDIIGGLKFDIVSKEAVPQEKIILFNNYSDDELESSLKAIREQLQSKPIFAVVTETSINWTFKELLKHLIEEREWYKTAKRGK
ncbi:DUF3783 domain-containing protein [Clostridium oryzae]|uniref:DUF3783 domain-containing protein n=1 Tax=Clostridium oryzae TaxID=1450648 RepID=A0A1V4ISL8_9CLOT|nr:DUF3783 domain-containing protein [Clostridium oryzae]OPJ63031.1 hypothetical protein CLORY_13970 [Clostridium oryzae]